MKIKVLLLFVMLLTVTMGASAMTTPHAKVTKDTISGFMYPPHMMQLGAMRPNMMHQNRGMMMQGYHGPSYPVVMKPYLFIVNQIPELRLELSLSDKEYEELVDLRTEYLQKKDGMQGELSKMNEQLHSELMNNAGDKTVKEQLVSISGTKTGILMAAYSTVEKMKNVMNSDQQKKLNHMISGMLNGNKQNGSDPMFYQRSYYE